MFLGDLYQARRWKANAQNGGGNLVPDASTHNITNIDEDALCDALVPQFSVSTDATERQQLDNDLLIALPERLDATGFAACQVYDVVIVKLSVARNRDCAGRDIATAGNGVAALGVQQLFGEDICTIHHVAALLVQGVVGNRVLEMSKCHQRQLFDIPVLAFCCEAGQNNMRLCNMVEVVQFWLEHIVPVQVHSQPVAFFNVMSQDLTFVEDRVRPQVVEETEDDVKALEAVHNVRDNGCGIDLFEEEVHYWHHGQDV